MARSYAQIKSGIWQDEHFVSRLSESAQRLYFLLLSQPNLNSAGVLPLQERRWKKLARDSTDATVTAALAELHAHWYVIVDEDTEEVLIRTFIRNDGLWRQPNVLKSALGHVENTMSATLRAVLRHELSRLPLDTLDGKRAEQSRTLVQTLLETLPQTLPEGFLEPPSRPLPEENPTSPPLTNGEVVPSFRVEDMNPQVMEVVDEPAQPVLEGFPKGFPEGFPEGSGVGAGVGEGAGVSFGEAQKKLPQSEIAGTTCENTKTSQADASQGLTVQAQQLADAFWQRYKTGRTQSFISIRQIIKTALGNGVDRDDLARALDAIGREERPVTGAVLQIALQQVRSPNVVAINSRQQQSDDLFGRAMKRARAREAQMNGGAL
ncbi:hypothetical protein [Marinactinospora rubrisoli]|uniref:Uncharacterized protein n=1 Tax=Marinactinospora rubrisoli TaxID=2715399 RepID=A0ABW2KLT5_9ACTN